MIARMASGVAVIAAPAAAQEWNTASAIALVDRAVARRAGMQADSGLQAFQARAHGFVFFLGQLGEEATTPRLIKADQLVVEVYWRAPGSSKQRIVGWRDRLDLPAGIQYHRDHLGIVTNGFGDRIRLGEGDEVRDVPHPLSPAGRALYDFALTDSLTIALPRRAVRVYEVLVRPHDFAAPRVAGALYLDAEDAELVRFRFRFTPSAYLDPTLEDISVELDNGLWDGRFWLPRRQEIEIRRRTEWLDLPARGIIRGRWEIGDYRLNVAVPESEFRGPEIVAAPAEQRATFPWPESLDVAVARAAGADVVGLAEVNAVVEKLVGPRPLSALPGAQAAARSVSDLVRVNRVEGIAFGAGWVLRPWHRSLDVRTSLSYGTADRRVKGSVWLSRRAGSWDLGLGASRAVIDVGDEPLASGLVNSLLAQEWGLDYGDYILRDELRLKVRRRLGAGTTLTTGASLERTRNLDTVAQPVFGSYRANAALGAGRYAVGRLSLERAASPGAAASGARAGVSWEMGVGDSTAYVRVRAHAGAQVRAPGGALALAGWAGWGSSTLPRHRALLWGGRGAVQCQPVARCGGRHGLAGSAEWRLGSRLVVAPFFTAGYVSGTVAGSPWGGTDGAASFGGVAIEAMRGLFRAEIGAGLRTGRVGFQLDVHRDLWGIL
ncbi:MAG TPA: hypothetical protein VNL18_05345 [Gemmatimonadales bacterium]|nr:hypothetical protein [Gemmatimonadales bacterium]